MSEPVKILHDSVRSKERISSSLERRNMARLLNELHEVERQLQEVLEKREPTKEWFDLYMAKKEGVNYYRNLLNKK